MAIATTSQNNAPYFDYPYVDSDTPAPEEVWQRWENIAGNWAAKIDRIIEILSATTTTNPAPSADFGLEMVQ